MAGSCLPCFGMIIADVCVCRRACWVSATSILRSIYIHILDWNSTADVRVCIDLSVLTCRRLLFGQHRINPVAALRRDIDYRSEGKCKGRFGAHTNFV